MRKVTVFVLLAATFLFASFTSNLCYAGLGEPLPVEDESSQAVTLDRLRAALLRESRIGGSDPPEAQHTLEIRVLLFMIAGALTALIILLIVWALGGFQTSSPKKGKWQIEHEKSPSGDSVPSEEK